MVLVGRNAERAAIDNLLWRVCDSHGGAVVVRGEAGIGKTALLDYAATRPGFRVFRGAGVQAESELAYAAAHQVLRPLLPLVGGLPAPQAHAVEVALGMADDGPPDRFLVALGFLSLLSEAARDQPVLCVVDDVQWCDSASTDALLFVVRRVATDPVAFVFGVRDDPAAPAFDVPGVPELLLSGLSEEAAAELLTAAGATTAAEVRAELVKRTRGNPLALVELARALGDDELAGREPLPNPLPLGDRLEHAFLIRTRRLSAAARRLMLVAAAEDSGDTDVIITASEQLDVTAAALAEAERSGLVRMLQGRLDFSHPLVRSAVYAGASDAERRDAHRVLATALGARGQTDRRAWHRAAAATGPDESIAAELTRVGDRARGRSGHGSASTAYERAADLSPNPADRARRLIAAADSAWLAGQPARTRHLVDRAESYTTDPLLRARLLHLRGRTASRNGAVDEAYQALLQGAQLVRDLAPALALQMLAEAVEAADYAGDLVRSRKAAQLAADLHPEADARSRFLAAWLSIGRIPMQGAREDTDQLRSSIDLAAELDDPRLLVWAGIAALKLGDVPGMQYFYRRAVQRARSTGAVASLPYPLEHVSMSEALSGSYASARSAAEEGLRLARETEQLQSACHLLAILAFIAGTRGDEDECRKHGGDALDAAGAHGLGVPAATATWALGRLDLALGRYDAALDRLLTLRSTRSGAGHPVVAMWATSDLVEAAVRAGRSGQVSDAVEQLNAWAAASGEPAAAATVAWSCGLLGRDEPAALLAEAADTFRRLHLPHAEARTRLALGELLRRNRQPSAARKHLREALTIFERLGGRPWADRAAAELRATGEKVASRPAPGVDQLTPQELQIVRLVCQGASNRDAAAQLFISPRTVEYHLYKVYPKLGISSRTQLIRQFGGDLQLTR